MPRIMTMDEDRRGFAAEYALGTLDSDERAQADALLLVDPEFTAEVRAWERRLGELNVLVAPIEPQDALWERIRAQIAQAGPSEPMRLPDAVVAPPAAASSAEIVDLTQRVRRWRTFTGLTTALAACLVAVVVARDLRPDLMPAQLRPKQQVVERVVEKEVVREVPSARPAQFVAVFQKDEQSPSFVMSVDIDKRIVTVRQVAAERLADKSYQLWIATQPGAAPQSLGVLGNDEFTVKATLAAYEPAVINGATFGISLEPLGGSPTDRPTGPVIHARLLQVTPPQNP
ncbi:MAG: anti-sigma factor [Alphaproteobacteria bacterium]|nr:anti-sigma factor [Alphaproteobacteria bacterium]